MLFTVTEPKMKGTTKRSGKPRRSKGCTTCIQRKVKCDEKTPTCGQCLKGGRKCSGMASAIFMNMDSTTMATTSTFAPRDTPLEHPKPKNLKAESPLIIEVIQPSTQLPTPTESPRPEEKPQKKGNESPEQDSSPGNSQALLPHVRSSQVITHQFLYQFLNFFARVSSSRDVIFNSWMGQLPEMLASNRQPLMGKSIAAASMIYFGRRTNNKTIMMEAYKSYGSGLLKQRQVLEDIHKTKRSPTIEELCTPLLMSFFEITCCTSQTAYFQHLLGAAMLLESYGPSKCSEGILFELFHALRLQLNYACIVMRTPSPFSTPEWLERPFAGRQKSQIDLLVDTIAICTSLHSRIENLKLISSPQSRERERSDIQTCAQELKTRLDTIWLDLRKRAGNQGWKGDYFNGVPGIDPQDVGSYSWSEWSEEGDVDINNSTMMVEYLNPHSPVRECFSAAGPNARPIGFYSTARVLVLACLHLVHADPALYEQQMEAHSASILATAEYDKGMDVGYAYLRLILPLHVVGLFSPRRSQRGRARALLEQWREMGGMTGICEVGLVGLGVESEETVEISREMVVDENQYENEEVEEVEEESADEDEMMMERAYRSRGNHERNERIPTEQWYVRKAMTEQRGFGYGVYAANSVVC